MITVNQLVEELDSLSARYASIENNPLSECVETEDPRTIQYSKKEIRSILGCSERMLEKWISELQEEGEYFVQDARNHYMVSPEQVPSFLKKANIKTIPELRQERDDYEVAVIIVNTGKGGIAKSTSALHLAVQGALDMKKQYRVVLIDGDPQGSLAKQLSPLALDGQFDSFLDIIKEGAQMTREERLSPEKQAYFREKVLALQLDTHIDNLKLIPASVENINIETVILECLLEKGKDNAMSVIKDVLVTPIKNDADLILFDTSPAPNSTTSAMYFASNHITLVATGRKQDYRSYIAHHDFLARTIEKMHPSDFKGVYSLKTIVTKHIDKNDMLSSKMRTNVSRIQATGGSDVYSQIIHENRKYEEAADVHLPLQLLDSKNDKPYRDALAEVRNLYEQVGAVIEPHLFSGGE